MVRTLLTAFSAVLLSASLCLAAPITLKLGHIAEPENPYGQGADYFAKLVKERSNGEIEIQVFPSSQLGNQRDLVEGLVFGTVDMTLTGTAVLGNFVPEVAVFDLPFIFRDIPHAYKALDTVQAWRKAGDDHPRHLGKRRAPHDEQPPAHPDARRHEGPQGPRHGTARVH